MLYYKFFGKPAEGVPPDTGEAATKYAAKAQAVQAEFSQALGSTADIALCSLSSKAVTGCILLAEYRDPHALAEEFLTALDMPVPSVSVDEVTGRTVETLLRLSVSNNFLESSDRLRAHYAIRDRDFRHICFSEYLLPKGKGEAEFKEAAAAMLWQDTLGAELERIYAGSAVDCHVGHPVHYLIECSDEQLRRNATATLLGALYDAGRIRGRRYGEMTLEPDDPMPIEYDRVIAGCKDCAVVVTCDEPDGESAEYASANADSLRRVCKVIRRHTDQTLSVLCVPQGCARAKQVIYDSLPGMTLVELRADVVFGARAKGYLRKQAAQRKIRGNAALYAPTADPKRGFRAEELHRIFDTWYARELKTRIYPQYAKLETISEKERKSSPKGSGYEQLQEMIGISEAKRVIGQALDYYKAQKLFRERDIKMDTPAMHMVFTGAPGTAKTTVARLFARIMKENGLLSVGDLVEVGRADLVGKYVGWTAQTVKEVFDRAGGCVLFIDEAYSLVDDRAGMFGDEAINTIVQEMENRRADTVVIFAGYPDKMEEFLSCNPGLRSRIAFHVPFQDYSPAELGEITALLARKQGLSLAADVPGKLASIFAAATRQPDFGNGRYARNVLERARMNQAGRIVRSAAERMTDAEMTTLVAADFEFLQVSGDQLPRAIGF